MKSERPFAEKTTRESPEEATIASLVSLIFHAFTALGAGTLFSLLVFAVFAVLSDSAFMGDALLDFMGGGNLLLIAAGVSLFLGGMVSGWIMESEVRFRRRRFAWLGCGSPALPVWIGWAIQAATRRRLSSYEMFLAAGMFIAPLMGAVIGYWVTVRRRALQRW